MENYRKGKCTRSTYILILSSKIHQTVNSLNKSVKIEKYEDHFFFLKN